jgi:hypothetical protein
MSDWDAILGEAALGLDLAKADPARADSRPGPGLGSRRAAEPATITSAAVRTGPGTRPVQKARPSPKLTGRPTVPTASREAIFRREALEFRVRGRDTSGGVVRLGMRWIRWACRMMLVLAAVAVAGLWVIHTNESASGPAVVDGRTGTVTLLLPAAAAPDLTGSQELTVALPGGRTLRIRGLHAQLASDSAIRSAGLAPLTQPAILLTGQLEPGPAAAPVAEDASLRTQASVVLRSESLASLLARQFHAMISSGTSP